MIKKQILTMICLGLLLGCTAIQPKRNFEDNTFTSDHPELKVKILKNQITNQGNKSQRRGGAQNDWWWWEIANREGVVVAFTMYGHSTRLDYYYGLVDVAAKMNRIPIETLIIKEHEWLKFVYVTESKYLHTGFFTRKGDCFISVYRHFYPTEYMGEVEKLDRAQPLTDSQKKLMQVFFDESEKLFTIEY